MKKLFWTCCKKVIFVVTPRSQCSFTLRKFRLLASSCLESNPFATRQLFMGLLCSFHPFILSAQSLFELNKKPYTKDTLTPAVQQQIFESEYQMYEARKAIIDEAIIEMHVQELMKKSKKSHDDLLNDLIKTPPATDKAMKAFYDENKSKIPYPYDQIKEEIKKLIEKEGAVKKKKELVDKLKKDGKFKLLLEPPVAPQLSIEVAGYPVKGNEGSKVTVVEFADYQCPHCKHAHEMMTEYFKKFPNKIKFVYIDFPINPSGISKTVSQGSFCIRKLSNMENYWKYHDLAFTNQASLNPNWPIETAKKLKVEEAGFKNCLTSKEAIEFVDKSYQKGSDLGVNGTPAIYLNGRKLLQSHDSVENFSQAVDEQLK